MDAEETLSTEFEKFQSWRPHPRQEDFLQIPYDVFEGLYGGALGGGKTDTLLVLPVVLRTLKTKKQLYEHPQFIGIIFRRTFPQLEKKIIPRANIIYKSLGATYNETKKCFTFPSGAKMFLGHMEKEKDVEKYDTDEYNIVGIDQAEQFTEYQLRYISSRIRSSNPDLPSIYRMAANPGGESHIYLRDRFVKPCINGNMILQEKVTGNKRIYIPAKLTDNPSLMDNDPEYINRLQLLPEAERESKINGDWFAFAGAVFSELRLGHTPGEPENANHTIAPFNIPEYWPKILAIDWGYAAHTFAIWGAFSPDGVLYIYRTYKIKRASVQVWASDIGRLSAADGKITRVALDPSAWKDQGLELTVVSQFMKYSGLSPERADNDRHTGVALIHEFLRWVPRPRRTTLRADQFDKAKSEQILILNGLKAYNEYLQSFIPEEEEKNIPKVKFFWPGTEDLTSALQSAQYDETDKEDYEEFDGDDPIDTFRYLLKISRVYLESAKNQQNILKLEEDIHHQLAETGDMTSWYNRMNFLDKVRKNSTPKPVRRYH